MAVCGGSNVFADRERRYPLSADLGAEDAQASPDEGRSAERDTRYPRVTRQEIVAGQPDVVLLPSEPYAFDEADREEILAWDDVPAAREGRVHLVDGSLLTWHGTRLALALRDIPPLLAI